MTEQPKMTLPNGDVLRDGDTGVTRGGHAVLVEWAEMRAVYPWLASRRSYTPKGTFFSYRESAYDIIARAPAPSTRPADEMDLTALCKPFGLLHPATREALLCWPQGVELYTSSGEWRRVADPNWGITRTYRAKPAPVAIRATIPWDFLVSDIQWVAMDEDGSWYGFFDSVFLNGNVWRGDGVQDLSPFTFPQGNEHWTETLQQRPDTRTEGSI